jgi:hypothetical protein
MADTKVMFYLQRKGEDAVSVEEFLSMTGPENEMICGILYSKCTGLFDKGKRLDVHTETYADSKEMRVWLGDEIIREPTKITLSLYFVGELRKDVLKSFMNFVENSKLYYWDTARLKKAYMVLIEAIPVKEDVYKGSTPYMLFEFKFQNLWGECKDCYANGNIK